MKITIFLPSIISGLRVLDTYGHLDLLQSPFEGVTDVDWVHFARRQIFCDGRTSLAIATGSMPDPLMRLFSRLDIETKSLSSTSASDNAIDSTTIGIVSIARELLREMRCATIHLGHVIDGLVELASPSLQSEWGMRHFLNFDEAVCGLVDNGRIERALEAGVLSEPLATLVRRLMDAIDMVPSSSFSSRDIVSHPAMADVRSASRAVLDELRPLTIDYLVALAGLDELVAARLPEHQLPRRFLNSVYKIFIESRAAIAMEANILSEELMTAFWRLMLRIRDSSYTPVEGQAVQSWRDHVKTAAVEVCGALKEDMANRSYGFGWDWSVLENLIKDD